MDVNLDPSNFGTQETDLRVFQLIHGIKHHIQIKSYFR